MLRVELFAWPKKMFGKSKIDLESVKTVTGVLEWIKQQFPQLPAWIEKGRTLVSVNHEIRDWDSAVQDGDEICFIPIISGGAVPWGLLDPVRVQHDPFEQEAEIRQMRITSKRVAVTVCFLGDLREIPEAQDLQVSYSEYEHSIVEDYLRDIRQRALEKFHVLDIRILLRVGAVPLTAPTLCVLVASEHEAEVFDACRWCVKEVRHTAHPYKEKVSIKGKKAMAGGF
jgi:molybdopterin synthase catalytic subunit/molybdopterin converting factor small subunit